MRIESEVEYGVHGTTRQPSYSDHRRHRSRRTFSIAAVDAAIDEPRNQPASDMAGGASDKNLHG